MGTAAADGFWAVTRDSALTSVSDLSAQAEGNEVLHVDPSVDAELASLIELAADVVKDAEGADAGYALAQLVCERMGGPVPYDAYEAYDPAAEVGALRAAADGSRVIRLGELRAGAARHRALLFKVLADRVSLPAALHTGKCLNGAHAHHSWATMLLDGKVQVVDLLHAPGSLYADGTDSARRYMRVDEFAFSSLASVSTVPFPLDTSGWAVKVK